MGIHTLSSAASASPAWLTREVADGGWPFRATRALLQLVLARPVGVLSDTDWEKALSVANRERLVAVAWHGGFSQIQELAPPTIVKRWRNAAIRIAARGRCQLELLRAVVSDLEADGLSPVVLKGAPLGARVYGDPCVRLITDIDLWIPIEQRAPAFDVLTAQGWRWLSGEAPAEESFEREMGGERHRLEVHSSIIDDPLLGYAELPVHTQRISVDTIDVPALADAVLAPALAAHLAKHHSVPLLWITDFCLLLSTLSAADLESAEEIARAAGLRRHFHRARRLACLAYDVVGGNASRLAQLACEIGPISELQRARRLLHLSSNSGDRIRIVGGRLWPRDHRNGYRRLPVDLALRLAGWTYRQLARRNRCRQSGAFSSTAESSDTLDSEYALQFTQPDESMRPSVPASSRVRVVRKPAASLCRGEVLLVRHDNGQQALRRLKEWQGEAAVVTADGLQRRVWLIQPERVIGVAERVDAFGVSWRVPKRAYSVLPMLCAFGRVRWQDLRSRMSRTHLAHVS
jgi:putative nucleotidyltransferase-like protein